MQICSELRESFGLSLPPGSGRQEFPQNCKKALDKNARILYNAKAAWEKALYAAIAQLVERILGKDEVGSPNLPSSSIKTPFFAGKSGLLFFTKIVRQKKGPKKAPRFAFDGRIPKAGADPASWDAFAPKKARSALDISSQFWYSSATDEGVAKAASAAWMRQHTRRKPGAPVFARLMCPGCVHENPHKHPHTPAVADFLLGKGVTYGNLAERTSLLPRRAAAD